MRDSLLDERGVWALPWNGASLLAYDMHPKNYYWANNSPDFEPSPDPLILGQGQLPNTLGPNFDILVRCADEDLAANELEGMPGHRWAWNLGFAGYVSAAPRSNHVGGVNGAFLDGHVAFLSDNIDPLVLDHYIDIRDEQVITDAGN